jgi:hypothetical protein
MTESNRPEHDEQIDAPRELIDALADLDNERIFVPPSVDEAIMSEARRHLKPGQASPERGCVEDQPQQPRRRPEPDPSSNAREPEAAAAGPQSGTQPRSSGSNIIAWSGWGVAIAASVVLLVSLTGRDPRTRQADRTPALMETADMAAQEEAGASAPAEAEAMTDAPAAEAARMTFAREDVNRDNTVDILDAFALARQIEGAQVVPASYDFNNDGAIDRADVDWVARVSVKL